ncbi:MAG: YncE family protein, partial [Candidatus Binatia bacterium]
IHFRQAQNPGSRPLAVYGLISTTSRGTKSTYSPSKSTEIALYKVSVIDTATNTVIARINLGERRQGWGVAISPDGTRAYVAVQVDFTDTDQVSVIDTATNTVVATVTVGSNPNGVSMTPDGTRVYVTNTSSSNVSVIDTTTNTVVATVAVGDFPRGVAITPDGRRAYVAGLRVCVPGDCDGQVSVIDTQTNSVVATVNFGFLVSPTEVAITPDGTRAYVATCASEGCLEPRGHITVIDTASNAIVATIPLGNYWPEGIAFTPDGKRAYVADGCCSRNVYVIDTDPQSPTTTQSQLPYRLMGEPAG